MKKKLVCIYRCLLLLVLLQVSCQRFDHGEIPTHTGVYPVDLSAGSSSAASKIAVSGTSLSWEKTDVVQLVAFAQDNTSGSADLSVYEIDVNDDSRASFSGFVSMTSAPVTCYFTYPAMSTTTINPENETIRFYFNVQTGLHRPFMYAKTEYSEDGINTDFVHVGTMLDISVNIPDVKQITFVGNRLEKLSPVTVNANTGNISLPDEANLQITVPVGDDGKVYIAVPPLKFEKGFSLICSNADGTKSMIKSYSTDGGLSSGYDFTSKRGHIIPVTISGEFENYSVVSSAPTVQHTKNASGLLTGTQVSFTMSKTGTSDKIVEKWGATLLNSSGQLVREASYTNSDPISGTSKVMTVSDNWKLLPGGTYIFTPYYNVYGQQVSLPSQVITISDPGVTFTVSGQTSYDKYLAGNASAANSHAYNLIEGVSVSTNVDASVIDQYAATLGGESITPTSTTTGSLVTAAYGNLFRNNNGAYKLQATMKVGNCTFNASRDFHITGLPLEANFTTGTPTVWTPSWTFVGITGYSNTWVTYKKGSGGLITPAFHVPASFNVQTALDADTNCSNSSDRVIHITTCSSSQSSAITSTNLTYTPSYRTTTANGLKSRGYSSWLSALSLTSSNNHLIYSVLIDDESIIYLNQTRVGIFKIKIRYQE